MSFQIKDFASVVAGEINHARAVTDKVTDFAPGSVVRTIIEAPAVEIEELYLQMFLGLRDAIPVATFLSFGFDRLPTSRAAGYASVSADDPLTADITIPSGTKFTTDAGASYTSTAAVVWASGSSLVQVPIQADVTGLVGNIAAGVITTCSLFQLSAGFTVSNSQITNGRDAESDAEREVRFAEFIQSLSRGTEVACLYATKLSSVLDEDGNQTEYVTRAGLTGGGGHVRIYLYSSLGEPSAELLADGQRRLDGYRDELTGIVTPGYSAAGVRVTVLPMVERAVPLSIKVDMLPGFTLTSGVEQDLNDLFGPAIRNVKPGDTLYLGTLVEGLLAAAGVQAIVPVTGENIYCAVDEALTPGALTVAAL